MDKIYRPVRPVRTIFREDDKECEVPKELWDEVCPKIEEFLLYLDSKGVTIRTCYDSRHYNVEMAFPSRRFDK